MLIPNVEVIWQFLFPKRSHPYCVTSVKTNENLMDRDIGKETNPYCSEGLNGMESNISVTKCGYKRSLKALKNKDGLLLFTGDSRAFWRCSNRA